MEIVWSELLKGTIFFTSFHIFFNSLIFSGKVLENKTVHLFNHIDKVSVLFLSYLGFLFFTMDV